jgi:hypothetical protein
MVKITNKALKNESQRGAPSYKSNGARYEEPGWMYENRTVEEMHEDEENIPLLLDRLRELGIVQVVKSVGRVFFFPIHNTRPIVLYDQNPEEYTKWEWLRPDHVYETVNYLMWKRLLKPDLALSFWGIFDCALMPESEWGCYYIGVGDVAFDHVNKWLSDAD